MIWSIIPEEVIFGVDQGEQATTVTSYLGKKVVLRQGKLDTLLSTDPQDYLDQRFAPGSTVNG